MTSKAKIFNVVTAAMLSGDDMLNVERDKRKAALSESTILAKICGSITNLKPDSM
jgi:hypothetical protein